MLLGPAAGRLPLHIFKCGKSLYLYYRKGIDLNSPSMSKRRTTWRAHGCFKCLHTLTHNLSNSVAVNNIYLQQWCLVVWLIEMKMTSFQVQTVRILVANTRQHYTSSQPTKSAISANRFSSPSFSRTVNFPQEMSFPFSNHSLNTNFLSFSIACANFELLGVNLGNSTSPQGNTFHFC